MRISAIRLIKFILTSSNSLGYPSPVDSEPPMPIHVPPPPQFFMNHHQQSLDGWKSPHSNTLEHNLKNKSHHNLIPFQNNLDTGNNVDFEPTCLMRTASGSLFIPNGMSFCK